MKVNINETEAAEQYGPSVHWFRRARWQGNGPRFIKLAGSVLYPVAELNGLSAHGCWNSRTQASRRIGRFSLKKKKLLSSGTSITTTRGHAQTKSLWFVYWKQTAVSLMACAPTITHQ